MNTRERIMAIVLLVMVLLGGGGFLYSQVYQPELENRRAAIDKLGKDNRLNEERISQVLKQRVLLDRARQLSLPPDIDLDRREYEKYLRTILTASGFAPGSFQITSEQPDVTSSPKLPGKKDPIYTALPFRLVVHGKLSSLVDALDRFYHTPLLQRVKSMQIQRPTTQASQQQAGQLDITLSIEALVLSGAHPRGYLLPNMERWMIAADALAAPRGAPAGLATALWAIGPTGLTGPVALDGKPKMPVEGRQYASIAGKNIFFGPTKSDRDDRRDDVKVTRYVYLTDISRSGERKEAWFYDRYNNQKTRLGARAGFDAFQIKGADGEPVLKGQVLRIDDRDLIFKADEKHYSIHVGENLEDALRKPLKSEQLKAMGLVLADDKGKAGEGQ